ncbi:NACHT domain-containing protein [[Phormidium] sp. ETS-05]|uniref:NACHT domain-containing protein n=1 Tax=[Phormidium] sp. ETS-05 TaxID=222819 RepID=UPI0018EF1F00
MGVGRSLLKLTIGTGCVVGGLVFPPLLAGQEIVWGTVLATALASVTAGNTANALDALTAGQDPDRVSLENQDLTKAVGKAIAAVITLEARKHPGKTRQYLEKIAAQAKDNWVTIAQQELTQQRYPDLREAKLDQFLTPEKSQLTQQGNLTDTEEEYQLTQQGNLTDTEEEYQLTQQGNLTDTEWGDIFIRLNMAACKGGGFPIPLGVRQQVAKLLHTTFPKALRETLKEDFANDGKAFAGLTLQLLTGMQAQLRQLQASQGGVNVGELSQILQQFQELETQLRGSVTQQQAFFTEISGRIDSGFAEVCQRLGVMETTIAELLQTLEERLVELRQEVTEFRQEVRQGLEALHNQPGGRQLSKQEYRNRQNILTQMRTEVESRLTQSIHRAAFVNLGKEQQPQQVQRPWDMSVKVGEQRSVQLPPQTTILDVFDNPTISGKFLILGKPGGGKTTTLLELAEALIERADGNSDAPIPVILELSSWQEVTKREFPKVWEQRIYDPSIKEWVLSQLMSKGVSQDIGEQWLREKELVLLLDGLDELQPERQAKCVRAINQFLGSEFSPLHLVVCSRKEEYEVYEEKLHLNGAICLEDLTNEQIRNYFASVNLEEFWETIKGSEKIVDFIRQPLFLAVTSIAYEQIDVEEWRNYHREDRAIDYLLGVYQVTRLKDVPRFYAKKESIEYLKTLNILIRLSKTMTETQLDNLSTYKIDLPFFISYFKLSFDTTTTSFYFHIINHIFGIGLLAFSGILLYWYGTIKLDVLIGIVIIYFLFHVIWNIFVYFLIKKTNYKQPEIIIISLIIFLVYCNGLDFMNKMGISTKITTILFTTFGVNVDQFYSRYIVIMELIIWVIMYSLFMGLGLLLNKEFILKNWIRTIQHLAIELMAIGIFIGLPCSVLVYLFIQNLAWYLDLFGVIVFCLLLLLILGFLQSSYNLLRHFLLRLTLWLTGQMPWNITRFLDYCTERLILQRVGNRYRFIHRLVQEHFANLEIQKE